MSQSHSSRIRIEIDHPNAKNAEAFLNSWSEPFVQEKVEGEMYIFRSTVSNLRLVLGFFDDQQDAIEYGKKEFDPISPRHLWSVNGGLLFAITGTDEELVGELASHFAGRE